MPTLREQERAAFQRWRSGHAAAARRQLDLLAEQGPDAAQAVSEALAAFDILYRSGPDALRRDLMSERDVQQVRRRWARIQKRAQAAR